MPSIADGMHGASVRAASARLQRDAARLPDRGQATSGCHDRAIVAPSSRNRPMRCVGRVPITFCQYCTQLGQAHRSQDDAVERAALPSRPRDGEGRHAIDETDDASVHVVAARRRIPRTAEIVPEAAVAGVHPLRIVRHAEESVRIDDPERFRLRGLRSEAHEILLSERPRAAPDSRAPPPRGPQDRGRTPAPPGA